MSPDTFDRYLADLMDDLSQARSPAYLDDAIERATAGPQRRTWGLPELGIPGRTVLSFLRTAPVIIAIALALAILGGAIVAGLVSEPSPSPEASASPSLTAEASLEPSLQATPARFVAGGSLIDARFQHAATMLSDGRVLVTGGSSAQGASTFNSTEIWNPVTNSTTASGSTDPDVDPLVRTMEEVILLPGGRVVLVAGGCWCNPMPVAPAEIWDPNTGAWQAIENLTIQRVGRSATLLADGRVLIAGGVSTYRGGPGGATADAFIWDPVHATSTPTGPMLTARAVHSATVLADGRVLVVGGNTGVRVGAGLELVQSAEIWDPRTGSFGVVPSLSGVRGTAITLPDGRVLIVNESSAILWDPRDDSVTDAGSLLHPRSGGQTVTLLADGRVLIVGGYQFVGPDQLGDTILEAELWDPRTLAFEEAGSLSAPRASHTTTALPDGRAVVVGGQAAGSPAQLIEVWEAARG